MSIHYPVAGEGTVGIASLGVLTQSVFMKAQQIDLFSPWFQKSAAMVTWSQDC
jgi:hypothetical protein